MPLGAALALLAAAPVAAAAQPPASTDPYPARAMSDRPCPASRDGLWALDPRVLHNDWAWRCHYREDNARVDPAHPPRAVFIGDSITENWQRDDPELFAHGFIDRGLSGQTSGQMLVRFWQDVIALHPRVVHIMAGTNDLAGNTGPTSPEDFKNSIRAMVTLARANNIQVVLAAIPPAARFDWAPGLHPAAQIAALNAWLHSFADEQGVIFADYHTVLATPDGAMKPEYSADGVHPNAAGYAAIRPLTEAVVAIAEALAVTEASLKR